MKAGDIAEIIVASFGYAIGETVNVLEVSEHGALVTANNIEKAVPFTSITKVDL